MDELEIMKKKPFDNEDTLSDESIELGLLRQFFQQWERLHAFKGAKDLQMECAQQLVDTAHHIRELGNGKKTD